MSSANAGPREQDRTVLVLDYDGTLHDSSYVYEPAFRAVMKEISALGWIPEKEYTSEEIRYWIGFSAAEMWMRFHPELSEEQRSAAGKEIGRLMLEAVSSGRGRLYPGTEETLEQLKANYELVFFSNCDQSYADTHRRAFGLDRWFSRYFCTGNYGWQQKEQVFAEHIYEPGRRYIAVGDRIKDMNLAAGCGLRSVGCLYGFGSEDELRPADVLIRDIRELPGAADALSRNF